MAERHLATLNRKGQITVPAKLRKAWDLKPGDQLAIGPVGRDSPTAESLQKRSIFERLDELRLPELGRPFTQQDIDDSVADATREKFGRSRGPA